MLRKKKRTKTKRKKGNGGVQVRWMSTVAGRAVKRAIQVRIEQENGFVLTNGEFRLQENGEYIARRMRKVPEVADLYAQCVSIWPDIESLGHVVGQRGHKGFYKNGDYVQGSTDHNPFVYSPEHYTNCTALQKPEVVAVANKLLNLREPYV